MIIYTQTLVLIKYHDCNIMSGIVPGQSVFKKLAFWRHKNKGLSFSLLGVFFPLLLSSPLFLRCHMYDFRDTLSSSVVL